MKYLSGVILIFCTLFSTGNLAGQSHGWTVIPAEYEYDGEVNAIVLLGTNEIITGTVGAFVGTTCRGYANGSFFPVTGKTIFSVRCYSNVPGGETLTFKWFDPSNSSYHDIIETVPFSSNMTVGDAESPLSFHIFVCEQVSIATNPSNADMCEDGGSASFTVSANGTAPFVYQWQYLNGADWVSVSDGLPAGAIYTGATTATLGVSDITSSGIYQYRCSVKNCSGAGDENSNSATLTVNALPGKPMITALGPIEFCSGGSVTLSSSAGSSYLWSTEATTQSINVTASGSYTVQVTNPQGCLSPPSDPVVATVNPLPATPTITTSGPTTFCTGGSVTLTSSGGPYYLWSTGATTQSINVSLSGSYTVIVSNANGCQSAVSAPTIVTANPSPGVNAGNDASIPNGTSTNLNGTVTGTGPFTYSWTPASLLVNAAVEDPVTVNLTSTTTFTLTATINATGCYASDAVTISVTGGALNASPTATPGTICAGESVQLNAMASGGSGTYTYLWSSIPAGFTSTLANPVAAPSISTTYQVAVNDGFSTVNRQVSVIVNPTPARPSITPSGPTTFCSGGSVTLISSAGNSYLWSTGATTQSIIVNSSGSYTVTVISSTGCESPVSLPVSVTVNPLPAAPSITASGTTTFCAGGNVTLTSSAGTTYQWSNGATTQSINVTTSGSYTVRITNANGCQSPLSTATVVTVNPLPGVNAGSDASIPNGTSTTLNGTVTGTGPFTYSWTPAALLVNAAVEDPATVNLTSITTFTFTARINATGCSNSDNVTISVLGGALNASPTATPGIMCAGETVQLDAAASGGSGTYTYLWSSVPAGFSSTLAKPTATPSVNTTYYVAVNDGFSTVNRQIAVTVNALPARPTITPSGPLTFCAGGSVTLTSSLATTYAWSTGATTRSINVTTSGNYTVKVTNTSGCESQVSEPVTVTVNAIPPAPTIAASGPTTICAGGSVTLTSSPGTVYLWSTGATTQNINVTSAGSYTVRITSASGCQSPPSTATVVTVNPNPGVNAGTDASIPNGTSTTLNATVTGTGPFTYSWTPASLLVNATVVDPVTVNLTSTTTFTLTATITATGCSASDAVTVSVTGGALNANPTATPGSVCAGSNVQLDAAASGGSGTYTYSWSSPTGFTSTIARPVVTPEVNTTYTVIVNDGFTSVGRQVPVTVNAIPPDPSITASGPVIFCIGGNVTLTSSSATNYLWSTGATSRSITVTTSGIYSVRVRNAAGCLSEPSPSTTVTVRPLPAAPLIDSIGHPTCTSATGSVRLAGLPETGIWTLTRYAGGITTTGAGSVSTVSGLPAGTYNFTVRDESGCTSLVSSNVIINAQPPTPSAPVVGTITHPTYTVPTGSVVLTGLPTPGAWRLTRYPGAVIINGSGSSRTVSGLEPGTYTFTVSNAVGCISASSASVLINARPGPPTVIITDPDTICSISTADLTLPAVTAGSDPNLTFTYWMDKDTVNSVPNPAAVPPGVYYIKGSTTANYYTIKPVTVTADQMPVADAGPDQVLGFTFTTNMDAYPPEAGSGIWSVDAGTGTFTNIQYAKSKVSDLSVGRNEFTWTVTNGACPPVSDKVVIQVNDLMVPSLITPNLDGNNDFLVIQGIESLGKTELIVFDRRGVEVFKDQNYNNNWDGIDIDKNPLPDDTYFYMITTGIGRTMRGFVVVRR